MKNPPLAFAVAALATVLPSISTAAQPPVASPYRPPTIALVQPAGVGTVPRDKPVVVFRFAPGESDDPIDSRSFTVTVDGADRSALFRVTADEAWGSLSGEAAADSLPAAGSHAVTARICSVRGTCATTAVTVTVDAGTMTSSAPPPPPAPTEKPPSSRARLIARVLDAIRKVFVP